MNNVEFIDNFLVDRDGWTFIHRSNSLDLWASHKYYPGMAFNINTSDVEVARGWVSDDNLTEHIEKFAQFAKRYVNLYLTACKKSRAMSRLLELKRAFRGGGTIDWRNCTLSIEQRVVCSFSESNCTITLQEKQKGNEVEIVKRVMVDIYSDSEYNVVGMIKESLPKYRINKVLNESYMLGWQVKYDVELYVTFLFFGWWKKLCRVSSESHAIDLISELTSHRK